MFAIGAAWAAPIDEVRRLYNEGQYEEAAEKARTILKRSPKDGNANYFLGASLRALGNSEEAIKPLQAAEARSVAQASQMLAEIAIDDYRVDDASEHLDSWERIVKKSKKSLPESFDEMSAGLITLRNMLERVEKIEILDSLTVDSADFFRYYRLSRAAGSLLPASEMFRNSGASGDGVVFMPENRSEMMWAQTGESGKKEIFTAGILDDGTIEHPSPSGDILGEGGDAAYPFIMPDGMTVYFANNGDKSLGGYDIFMTRRNDDGSFFEPQNIGMPYNSPYDDYMLAIDETSGLGWWATDRNQIPGKVTIYIYLPSETRVNCEPDDPDLTARAKITSIALTQREGVDYKALLEKKLPEATEENTVSANPRFELDMGNGRLYTSLDNFKNPEARRAMIEVMAAKVELRKNSETLDALREKFRKGDRSVSHAILQAERERQTIQRRLRTATNQAIRLETK